MIPRRVYQKKGFSRLPVEEQFHRLFEQGFSREDAEQKLQYPYLAVILPKRIKDLWTKAKASQDGLRAVYGQLGGFTIDRPVLDPSPAVPTRELAVNMDYNRALLEGIADRMCGSLYEYGIYSTPTDETIVITAYHGGFV